GIMGFGNGAFPCHDSTVACTASNALMHCIGNQSVPVIHISTKHNNLITRKQYRSAKDTVAYFDHSLAQADYHTNDGLIEGKWNGQAAERLRLGETVHRDEFEKICHNVNPD